MPIFTRSGRLMLDIRNPMPISKDVLEDVKKDISSISFVLSQLVPGLTIDIKKLADTLSKNGEVESVIMLYKMIDNVC